MKQLVLFLATGLGSGYSPRMPGTVGSLVALVLAAFLHLEAWQIILLSLAGVAICSKAEDYTAIHDNPAIVFDEFCGIFIAAWHLSSINQLLIAFLLFRLFDIIKPFPINRLQGLPRGWGIMADDIAAGLISRIIIFFIWQI